MFLFGIFNYLLGLVFFSLKEFCRLYHVVRFGHLYCIISCGKQLAQYLRRLVCHNHMFNTVVIRAVIGKGFLTIG